MNESIEYKRRFIAHLMKWGATKEFAEHEFSAWNEAGNADGSPEDDADDCISYWSED